MLGFIKKFRNSPRRTVLTVKCKHSFYLLKRCDIVNCEQEAFDDDCKNHGENNHENSILEKQNAALWGHASTENVSQHAFKSYHNCCNLDGVCDIGETLERDNFDGEIELNSPAKNTVVDEQNKLSRALKPVEKSTKGALVCNKMYRVLLCDFLTIIGVATVVLCLAKKLIFRKNK